MSAATFLYRQFFTTPPAPTASFAGKTAIVTGSNTGLGKEAVRWMASLGASKIIIACRNVEKGKAAAADIEATTGCAPGTLEVWPLNLGSYTSVLAFADRVNTELPRLDILLSNAGLVATSFSITEDNEESITTNVVSLFLHALLLFPKLHETAVRYNTQSHFTVTCSEVYAMAAFTERNAPMGQIFSTLNDPDKANMPDRYNVAKLLELIVVKQLAALAPLATGKIIMNCVGPGVCNTDFHSGNESKMMRRVATSECLSRSPEVGSRTLVAGASAGPDSHGQFMPDCIIEKTRGLTVGKEGAELQQKVWVELQQKLEAIRPGVTSLSFAQ